MGVFPGITMATFNTLRLCGGLASRRVLGTGLLKKPPTSSLPVILKKSVSVTPALQGRIYGPEWKPDAPSLTSHWKQERILSAVLVPVIPIALVYPNMITDFLLTSTIMLHTHWGFQVFISDYFHGPILPRVLRTLMMVFSSAAFGGLLYLNYNDIGFSRAILMLFASY